MNLGVVLPFKFSLWNNSSEIFYLKFNERRVCLTIVIPSGQGWKVSFSLHISCLVLPSSSSSSSSCRRAINHFHGQNDWFPTSSRVRKRPEIAPASLVQNKNGYRIQETEKEFLISVFPERTFISTSLKLYKIILPRHCLGKFPLSFFFSFSL